MKHISKRLCALLLAAVLLVVLFAAYRDGTGFDILRRYLHYGRSEQVGGATVYRYESASKNRFISGLSPFFLFAS